MTEIKGLSFDASGLYPSELEKLERRPLGTLYTPNGEVLLRQVEGGDIVRQPLEVEDLTGLPTTFNHHHAELLADIYSAVDQINEMPDRAIPLTRGELVSQFGKSKEVLSELVDMGLVKDQKIETLNKDGTKASIRRVIYFTPQGRAYVRTYLDPAYCTHQEEPVSVS